MRTCGWDRHEYVKSKVGTTKLKVLLYKQRLTDVQTAPASVSSESSFQPQTEIQVQPGKVRKAT
jgi:hypothetical protein